MENAQKYTAKELIKLPEDRFFNRELSWLAFNERVLEEASNAEHPVLERLNFLAISASNLDEFFMVRVAGLKDQVMHGVKTRSMDGMTPREQLAAIQRRAARLVRNQQKCWKTLIKNLAAEGIEVLKSKDLSDEEKQWLEEHFFNNIFPALTPIAIDPAHPFPFLPNLSLAVVLDLKRESKIKVLNAALAKAEEEKDKRYKAIIPLPQKLGRFVELPTGNARKGHHRFITIEDAIKPFQEKLFPGSVIIGTGIMRITRDSELEVSDAADDLVTYFESAVKQRRRGQVIRLRINQAMPSALVDFVVSELGAHPDDVVIGTGMLGIAGVRELIRLGRVDLKYAPIKVRFPERIDDYGGDCFAAIAAKDIVIHHPYESFDVVVQYLHQAARDPNVVAIKQTLYRTSNDSPIVKALIEAAEAGKSVTVIVELKARFDEEANLRWGRDLERAGAQVIYGLVGLKTHVKASLIVRRNEDGKLQSYVHLGTGNYHPQTAKVYSDLSYFTCDPVICSDMALLFNFLTGYSPPEKFSKISVAPLNLRHTLMQLIDEEIEHARAGRPANIWAKMNSLVDPEMIDALYTASQAGVKVQLVVRGICCLRPGIEGLSENIRVRSIVGRFLEHARIFCFGSGHALPSSKSRVYISSADWMPRNLNGRVELMVPIENATVHEQIIGQIMQANLRDEKNSWILNPEGAYERVPFEEGSFSAHDFFINNPSLSGRGSALRGKKGMSYPDAVIT